MGIFLDVKKAFDRINHKSLLKNLNDIELRVDILELIHFHLTGGIQIIKINNLPSNQLLIKCNVPQCMILGPLLFIIYTNNLLKLDLDANIICYADVPAVMIQDKIIESLFLKSNAVIK